MNFSIYSIACIKRDFLTLSTINSNSFDINSKNQIGNSLLHLSVYNKHLDVVSFLLQKGADINIVNAKNETDKTAYQAPYFADTSKSILANKNISVEFLCFNEELKKIIDEYKDYFFIYENFGTRQNKGFGSFLRANIEDKKIGEILSKHINPCFSLGSYKDYQNAFLKIDDFYKKLKMGINNPYFKSLLFRYMCEVHNVGWEKKFIKKN